MNQLPIERSGNVGNDPRTVDFGQGLIWLKQGWQLFAREPGVWVAVGLVLFIIYVILGVIPFFGPLAASLLSPVFIAGLLLGCRSLDNGGALRFDHLFSGFSGPVGPLVTVGAIYLGGMLLISLLVTVVGGGAALSGIALGRGNVGVGMATAFSGILLAGLLSMLLSIPLMMAFWFAPSLVLFKNMAPLDAMKTSFAACLKNVLPFFLYGIISMVLFFIALIPLGLGLLVLVPWLVASLYASYVDIFE